MALILFRNKAPIQKALFVVTDGLKMSHKRAITTTHFGLPGCEKKPQTVWCSSFYDTGWIILIKINLLTTC